MKYSLTLSDMSAKEVLEIVEFTQSDVSLVPGVSIPVVVDTGPISDTSEATTELDSSGIPWDKRIHSGNKKQKKDGTWNRRKNLQDMEFDAVVDELKEKTDVSVSATIPPVTPTVPDVPPVAQVTPSVVPPVAQVTPSVVPSMPGPVTPVIPQAASRDFQGLMQRISDLFAKKLIDTDYIKTIVSRVNDGFQSNILTITDLANDLKMVEYAWQCLDADGKAV